MRGAVQPAGRASEPPRLEARPAFSAGAYPSVADDSRYLAAELWRVNADFHGLDIPARLHRLPEVTPVGARLLCHLQTVGGSS
jgi:hypothetical protein